MRKAYIKSEQIDYRILFAGSILFAFYIGKVI